MKYVKMVVLAMVCGLFVVGNVNALTFNDVDTQLGTTQYTDQAGMLEWVNDVVGGNYTEGTYYTPTAWTELSFEEEGSFWYTSILDSTEYFLVEFGDSGGTSGTSGYSNIGILFENGNADAYALAELFDTYFAFMPTGEIVACNFQSITTFGADNCNPVPEPSTMMLLGTGIMGLGFAKRKSLFGKEDSEEVKEV